MANQKQRRGWGRYGMLLPVYVPTGLLAFGQGLLIPTLPLYALSFEIPYALVSLVVGAAALGTLVTDLPAGMLLSRIGRKPAMLFGTGLVAISTLALVLAHGFPELFALRIVAGIGTALWTISRHAFITEMIAPAERGRSLSAFGGINRIGVFGGPVAGGLLGSTLGLQAPLMVTALMAVSAMVLSFFFVHDRSSVSAVRQRQVRWQLVGQLVKTHRADLASAGVAQTFAQMIRAGRQLILPLYGSWIGLDIAQIGTIMSVGSVVDMLLFVPAGIIMDRFGRKFAAVPSFTIMAIGMAMIPLMADFWTLMLAAIVIGFGNGLGSGIMMTLGADLAPPGATGEFLGLWRLIGDTGAAGGPLVVGALADVVGLALTSIALAGAGVTAAIMLAWLVRETRHAATPSPTSPPTH